MDTEKHAVNTFCQGMQEAMAKTHAAMVMEAQRQYESKERIYRSHLVALGTPKLFSFICMQNVRQI